MAQATVGGAIAVCLVVLTDTVGRFVGLAATGRGATTTGGPLARIRAFVRRLWCGLAGHDMVRHFEPGRLALRCLRCGAQTRGWTLDVKPAFRRPTRPVVTYAIKKTPAASSDGLNAEGDSHARRAA